MCLGMLAGFVAVSQLSPFFMPNVWLAPVQCRGGLWSAGDGGSAVVANPSGQCGTQQDKSRCHLCFCHRLCLNRDRGTGVCTEGATQGSWVWRVQNQPVLGTQIGAGRHRPRPLDNCSSQPFLISREISRVPAQRDAHRDKVLRKQLTMPLHWQGSVQAPMLCTSCYFSKR